MRRPDLRRDVHHQRAERQRDRQLRRAEGRHAAVVYPLRRSGVRKRRRPGRAHRRGSHQAPQYSPTRHVGRNVSLAGAGKLLVIGNRIAIDFGVQGIGGNRNSATGNGWYRFVLDADDNGTFETYKRFYRLRATPTATAW